MRVIIFTFLLSFTAFSNTVDELLKECSPNATIKRLGNQYDEDRFDYEISVSHIKISLGEEYISGALGNQKIKGRENREKWIYHEKNGFDDPLSHYDEEDEEVDEEDKEYQYIMHVLDPTRDASNVLKNPYDYFKNLKRISTSFIHEKDTIPFYKAGGVVILVKLDPQYIIAAAPKNLSSLDSTLASANSKGSILTPAEMKMRRGGSNNEILSIGGVTPIGYGIFGSSGKPLYQLYNKGSTVSQMLSSCKRFNLPVVLLEKTNVRQR